ncbi:MAG: HD domain-containing protein [Gemmatales bacterium]
MLHPAQHTSRHVLNAILAGLLHDLGMARLPTKVLAAQVRTDPTSKQQWRNHATWLAERLRPHLKPEEFDVGLAIAQHHERLDATGYPLKLKQGELIELGRQLAVADTYAALCQARPHRPAHHTRQATQLVLKEAQWGRLDQLAALMLIPWGMAPVGSRVELSDGSEGEVISWAHVPLGTNTLRPVIALHQQNRGKILDLDLVRDRHIIRILDEEQKRAG